MIHEHSRSITPAVGGASDTVERHGIIGMPGGTPPTVAAQCHHPHLQPQLAVGAGGQSSSPRSCWIPVPDAAVQQAPACLGREPADAFKNSEIRMLTQRSRMSRTQPRSSGRKSGPLSTTITQAMPARSRDGRVRGGAEARESRSRPRKLARQRAAALPAVDDRDHRRVVGRAEMADLERDGATASPGRSGRPAG